MRATGARRVAKGLAFLAAIVVPAIGHAAPAAVDPARGSDPSALTASIRIDGPPLRVSLQPAGRAARVGFVAAAGQRLGFGIAGVRFTPASAAALVVTVRQPDGSMVPGTSRVHCFAAKGTEPVCDGELTTRQAGRHVLEIDAPFSAAATLELVLSSPVAADLQAGKSHTIAVSRAGQDARLQLSLEPGADLSISAWGAGTQAAGQGASTCAPITEFSIAAGDTARFAVSATAGQGLTIAVQGLAHAPDVDYGSSAIELLKPDGGRVESRSCLTAYVPVFAARMQFLLPEWGGDFAAVDRFVRTATERTEALEGRAMHAWLYLELARRYGGLLDRSLAAGIKEGVALLTLHTLPGPPPNGLFAPAISR